jgi:hypothetical protein
MLNTRPITQQRVRAGGHMWHIGLGGWAAGVLVRVFWMSSRGVTRPPRPTLRQFIPLARVVCLRIAPPTGPGIKTYAVDGSRIIRFLFAVFCCHNPGPPFEFTCCIGIVGFMRGTHERWRLMWSPVVLW